MTNSDRTNLYEVLEISENAEPETVRRLYRLLAQRYHPDNQETGDATRFRLVSEAYAVLGDAERRAEYDATRRDRQAPPPSQPVQDPVPPENDYSFEQAARLAVLDALYTERRLEPSNGALYDRELSEKLGVDRDRLEFTIWYLKEKGFVKRASDSSRLNITAEGAEFLESHPSGNIRRRLVAFRQTA